MEATTAREGHELWRPNREKPESKTTKAIVALVLLISAALIALITLGGWERLQSSSVGMMSLIYAGLYVVFAILVARWSRGILPVAAALAIILTIFAAVAAPDWFDRAKDGLDSPVLPEDLIGLLTLILVPVQILLIVVAMVGFNQDWHVEEERPSGEGPHSQDGDHPQPWDQQPGGGDPFEQTYGQQAQQYQQPDDQRGEQSWEPPPQSAPPPPLPPHHGYGQPSQGQ